MLISKQNLAVRICPETKNTIAIRRGFSLAELQVHRSNRSQDTNTSTNLLIFLAQPLYDPLSQTLTRVGIHLDSSVKYHQRSVSFWRRWNQTGLHPLVSPSGVSGTLVYIIAIQGAPCRIVHWNFPVNSHPTLQFPRLDVSRTLNLYIVWNTVRCIVLFQ